MLTKDVPLTVSAKIKNIGNREGTETVQLYIRDVQGSVIRPLKKLKGFKRVTLQRGEEQTVSFVIDRDMLKFTRADLSEDAEPGLFYAYVGGSSATDRHVEFTLAE